MNYAKVKLDLDPIYVACEVMYRIDKGVTPTDYGEKQGNCIVDIELFQVDFVEVDLHGNLKSIERYDEDVVVYVREEIRNNQEDVVEQIMKQFEFV